MNKQHKSWMVHLLSLVLLIGIFALTALLLVNVGMGAYKNIVLANNNNFQLRTSLSYIATKVRQSDTKDSTYLDKMDGTDILVLGEKIDGENYETRIYYYKGHLCELFTQKNAEYDLSYGTPVIEIAGFKMSKTDSGCLLLTAIDKKGDSQELLLSLRSGRSLDTNE